MSKTFKIDWNPGPTTDRMQWYIDCNNVIMGMEIGDELVVSGCGPDDELAIPYHSFKVVAYDAATKTSRLKLTAHVRSHSIGVQL